MDMLPAEVSGKLLDELGYLSTDCRCTVEGAGIVWSVVAIPTLFNSPMQKAIPGSAKIRGDHVISTWAETLDEAYYKAYSQACAANSRMPVPFAQN
jgi:hypothetical protein